jgi:ribonuclease-3
MIQAEREVLESALGHHFRDPEWLERALTHRSHREGLAAVGLFDNERLEFLGDRVLGLVVSEHLLRTFPDWDAGRLSKRNARLVSTSSLEAAARRTGLGQHLRLGRGEEKTGGREKRNLLADVFEAVIAAIYLDGGLEAAARFIRGALLDTVSAGQPDALEQGDYKSALQEWMQQRGRGLAEYRVVRESGPDHQKIFSVEIWLDKHRIAGGEGSSKKEAEQKAARTALEHLESEVSDTAPESDPAGKK